MSIAVRGKSRSRRFWLNAPTIRTQSFQRDIWLRRPAKRPAKRQSESRRNVGSGNTLISDTPVAKEGTPRDRVHWIRRVRHDTRMKNQRERAQVETAAPQQFAAIFARPVLPNATGRAAA
jgi:hypothetical protein